MSNALGRLLGTLGSGILFTFVGEEANSLAGPDAVKGLAACFFAGTVCSLIAVFFTLFIDDDKAGLSCGSCWTIVDRQEDEDEEAAKEFDMEDEWFNAIAKEVDC